MQHRLHQPKRHLQAVSTHILPDAAFAAANASAHQPPQVLLAVHRSRAAWLTALVDVLDCGWLRHGVDSRVAAAQALVTRKVDLLVLDLALAPGPGAAQADALVQLLARLSPATRVLVFDDAAAAAAARVNTPPVWRAQPWRLARVTLRHALFRAAP